MRRPKRSSVSTGKPPLTHRPRTWRDHLPQPPSPSQLRGLSILLALAIAVIAWRAWRSPISVSDPPPDQASRAAELLDRLDPNTATAAELSVLPNIGPKRAADIIAYRDSHGPVAFQAIDDLTRVKGIGEATIYHIRPFVVLPADEK